MEQQNKTHPVLIAAGIAVLVFSMLGAAALMGVLPTASTKPAEVGVLPQSGGTAVAQRSAPAPTAQPARPAPAPAKAAAAPCATCGVIESVREVQVKGESSGIGAVAGGVAGGLVGNQFGSGGTRALLTIGGAAGGAFAGDAIERNVKKRTAWRVTVRLDDGTVLTLSQKTQPPFGVGERVRIVDGSSIERA